MEEGELTATELARVLPVDASRISRLVTRMVDRKLLIRRRLRHDRRVVMLRLSEDGNELTAELRRRVQAYYSTITENVSDEEMRVFRSTVFKMLDSSAVDRPSG